MKTIYKIGLSLILIFFAVGVFAAPKIIVKDLKSNQQYWDTNKLPMSMQKFVRKITNTQADLYQIVIHKADSNYVLYLLSGKKWEAQSIRVDLDATGNIHNVINHYTGALTEENNLNADHACPDPTVQFLVISAYPGVGAVDDSIAIVSKAAQAKYKTMTILDNNADGKTYRNWLSCPNLVGIYSIGHGSQRGIMVGHGDMIDYTFFAQPDFANKYKNTTVLINACLVYNYPFATEILFGNSMAASDFDDHPGPNAHQYIGGHVNLNMYSSELSSACFMAKAIDGEKMDYDTLRKCVGDKNIHFKNFGMSNQGSSLVSQK